MIFIIAFIILIFLVFSILKTKRQLKDYKKILIKKYMNYCDYVYYPNFHKVTNEEIHESITKLFKDNDILNESEAISFINKTNTHSLTSKKFIEPNHLMNFEDFLYTGSIDFFNGY